MVCSWFFHLEKSKLENWILKLSIWIFDFFQNFQEVVWKNILNILANFKSIENFKFPKIFQKNFQKEVKSWKWRPNCLRPPSGERFGGKSLLLKRLDDFALLPCSAKPNQIKNSDWSKHCHLFVFVRIGKGSLLGQCKRDGSQTESGQDD